MNQGGASRFVLANNNPLRGGGHLELYNGSFRSGADIAMCIVQTWEAGAVLDPQGLRTTHIHLTKRPIVDARIRPVSSLAALSDSVEDYEHFHGRSFSRHWVMNTYMHDNCEPLIVNLQNIYLLCVDEIVKKDEVLPKSKFNVWIFDELDLK